MVLVYANSLFLMKLKLDNILLRLVFNINFLRKYQKNTSVNYTPWGIKTKFYEE